MVEHTSYMGTSRMEAFSDGVIAIILTIMVLELKLPHAVTAEALMGQLPVFLSYLLSFLVVAIMWINHHHLVHTVKHVTSRLLWRNIHLLLWMSLIPFSTGLIGEDPAQPLAAGIYGLNMALASLAFLLLGHEAASQQTQSPLFLARRQRRVRMEALSVGLYLIGTTVAFFSAYAAYAIYVVIPLLFFIPQKPLAAPARA